MKEYNLIYNSKENDHYLWNGNTFDNLESKQCEVLFYSGKSIEEVDVQKKLERCRIAAKKQFPEDASPEIKMLEISILNPVGCVLTASGRKILP